MKKTEDRFIRFHAEVEKRLFWQSKCENRYDGSLKEDRHGRLQTTKPDAEAHGFGLSQMSAIAGKYHSLLDISHSEDHIFVVQTALKLPKEKGKMKWKEPEKHTIFRLFSIVFHLVFIPVKGTSFHHFIRISLLIHIAG